MKKKLFSPQHNSITYDEAKIILQTEWQHQNKSITYKPKSFCPPAKSTWRFPKEINFMNIQTAHIYSISYGLVCQCLEVCGLRKEKVCFLKIEILKHLFILQL